jgi:hypothetical protein
MRPTPSKDAARRSLPDNSAPNRDSSELKIGNDSGLTKPIGEIVVIKMGMMRKPRDEKLASQIVEEFHLAGQRGDVAAFKRLLGQYGAHLSTKVKDQMIAEFRKNASLLRDALKGK